MRAALLAPGTQANAETISLLPVLNEALIKHQLRALRQAGIEYLHIDPAAHRLRRFFRQHHSEGISISFGSPDAPQPLLVLKPHVLPKAGLTRFLADFAAEPVRAALAGAAPGGPADVWAISANYVKAKLFRQPQHDKARYYQLENAYRIETVADYLQTTALLLPGECRSYRKLADGVHVDDAAFISPQARLNGSILIGRNSSVAEGVRLEGTVVLGEGVMICRNALVQDSVILPGAAIGSNARVVESVVAECFTVGPGAVFNRCLAVEHESSCLLGLSPGYHLVETSPRGPLASHG